MSKIFQEIIIPKTLTDYCEARKYIVADLMLAHSMFSQAEDKMNEIYHYGLSYETKPRSSFEEACKDVDRRLWRLAFDVTNFSQIMDKKARKEFEDSLNRNPPEFSEDNVRSIFISTAQDADMMFARGLVEVFLRLSNDYKTNRKCAFKVEKKVILTYTTSLAWKGGVEIRYGAADKLNDIDRVIKTLDGKQYHPREFETLLNGAFKKGEPFEDEYYRARGYKNGNVHLEFKRPDLLEKANKVIADYYDGNALGEELAA